MTKKNLDDFLKDDIYKTPEGKELLDLAVLMSEKDFSKNSDKNKVYKKTIKNINEGVDNMKKSKNLKIKVASIALVCIMGFSVMQTTFAQELMVKIVKTIKLNNIEVAQEEILDSYPIPENFIGKIFDKDGNKLESITRDMERVYTADGEPIADIDEETGEITTVAEADKNEKNNDELIIKDKDKLNDYTCFDVLLPEYLPEGYEFDKATGFSVDEDVEYGGESKYMTVHFKNKESGEEFLIAQRFADKETGYSMSTVKKIREIEINGVKAIVMGDENIDWEYKGVIYALTDRGNLSVDELVKIAESIKK